MSPSSTSEQPRPYETIADHRERKPLSPLLPAAPHGATGRAASVAHRLTEYGLHRHRKDESVRPSLRERTAQRTPVVLVRGAAR
ncbi:hypothetical protein [Streptomyces echinatus]|uniref:Uncharacterized protein n=1 Tax=Streptomyces echinatus TaxID=67293 RepID=A0A7W9UP62_9ACTN|nr:hypothetical protein [Streptomyces echinatus]MBB5926025.1 hypothetical protein [Streptomyces echinatus]